MSYTVLQFQTTDFPAEVRPDALFINVYRIRGLVTTRILQVAAGREYYQPENALPDDRYYCVWWDADREVEGPPSPVVVARSVGLYAVAVTGYLRSGDGTSAGSGYDIKARLFTHYTRPFSIDGDQIVGSVTTSSGTEGDWTLYLAPTDRIRPTGAYWEIEIDGKTSYKYVLSTSGLAQNFTSLPDATPFEVA
jgi:hypothetical protein